MAKSDSGDMVIPPAPTWPKIAQFTDRFGNAVYYGNAGDYMHPAFAIGKDTDYRTFVRRIRDMEIRPDDVIVSSFPKTGLHWNHEIISMLMTKRAQYVPPKQFILSFLDVQDMAVVDKLPSPRLLLVHVPFRYFPKQAFEKKVKIIRLERNPKDALSSFYYHLHNQKMPYKFPGTFYEFFRLYFDNGYMYGDIFDYLMEWQEGIDSHPDVDVYTSVFEEMKKNPVEGVLKLNAYLGTGCSQEFCEKVADLCGIEKLKAEKNVTMAPLLKRSFEEGSAPFYRKGEVGDWKNMFTMEMDEEFEEEYKKRMAGYKRKYQYTIETDDTPSTSQSKL